MIKKIKTGYLIPVNTFMVITLPLHVIVTHLHVMTCRLHVIT
jgi:hypothetical protein